ncbi:MAG: Gfo/Idh/MocA family oxidoreductase [Acidimicrobiia bacterium]|nr:Gfo/Idh/MocA family oxidoreductase [Acidimicrobiia bacterium]
MLRIALIGCGHIGTVHSYALAQLRGAGLIDASVTATFDPDLDRAALVAEHHQALACDQLEAALDEADVAWICTWTAGHVEAVAAAVERDLAVFCEKPLAPTIEECRTIADQLRGRPHQVGLVLRHAPVFACLADAVGSGRYGRPMTMVFRDDQYFPIQGMYGSTWRADVAKAGGGTLIEHSIHDVDLMQWILGPVAGVRARTSEMFGYPGIEDVAVVGLDFESGVTATLTSVWHQVMSRPSTRRVELFCEDALLWTEDDYLGPVHLETSSGVEEITGLPPEWIDRLTAPEVFAKSVAQYAEPSKAFLDALTRDGTAAEGFPSVDNALAAHEVVDAAYRSATAGGAPVPVPGSPAR